MTQAKERVSAEELSKLVLEMMTLAKPPPIPADLTDVESLQTLYANLLALREFLYAASNGDLSKKVPFKGYIGGAIKTLQANLRHMAWQTTRVSAGDFTQRLNFMGEFSHSFNAMVVQLDQTLRELVRKDTELSQANEELLKEISIRKKTEAALRKSEKALQILATKDPLTGLFNRRHFNRIAEKEIRRTIRYGRPLSAMMFDIDFFKRVNDTFGHAAGDLVLKSVARIAMETVRTTDIVARYGGEEFVVLLPETPAAKATILAERLRGLVEISTVTKEGQAIMVTASFGISDFPHQTAAKTPDTLLTEFVSYADQALYASKKSGRNRVTVYEPAE